MNQKELEKIFNSVCNPEDWKAPIDVIIKTQNKDKNKISEAIIHFTGTIPIFENGRAPGFSLIKAQGYRNGPCGDY